MDIISISGIAIISTLISVLLRKDKPEIAIIVSLSSGIVIFYIIILRMEPLINKIKDLVEATGMSANYLGILLKVIAICFLAQFASDSCKDAGESAMASKVELAGKILIIITALPLFEDITKIAIDLIS